MIFSNDRCTLSRIIRLQMRQVVRERGDLFFAQGIGNIGHHGHAAAGSPSALVVVQRLDEIFLALAGKTRDAFRAGKTVRIAGRSAAAGGGLGAFLR
jgi:hypothetical protein